MEARLIHLSIALSVIFSMGATYRTPNFTVTAPTQEIAVKAGKTAEHFRSQLAKSWLGKELPSWSKPCKLKVKVGQYGAGGATTFQFHKGHVYGWDMRVQGSLERVLDSVIPHEVSHTIFASYFRRPLPRWADEGAATLIEDISERRKQHLILKQVFNTSKRIPLKTLLQLKEYPKDRQDVYTLYAEGYSLSNFLVKARGKKRFLQFLETAHHHGWTSSLRKHYNLETVDELEKRWNNWIVAGSPELYPEEDIQLAKASEESGSVTKRLKLSQKKGVVIRSQSPESNSLANNDTESKSGKFSAPNPASRIKRSQNDNLSYTLASQKRWQIKKSSGDDDERDPRKMILFPKNRMKEYNKMKSRSSSKVEKYRMELPLKQQDDSSRKKTESGVSDFSSNHEPNWTDFPQRRKGHGAAKLGKNSTGNSSH